MKLSTNQQFIIGISLLLLAFLIYEIFQSTKTVLLAAIVLTNLAVGIYLIQARLNFLKQFRQLLTFVIVVAAMYGIFVAGGWDIALDASPIGAALAGTVANFTVLVLNAFGIHAFQESDNVMLPPDSKGPSLQVAAECAGSPSLTLFFIIFGMMIIDLRKKVSYKRLVGIFMIGISLVLAVNLIRIPILGYISYAYGGEALEMAHAYAGYLFLIVSVGVFLIVSMRLIPKKPMPQGTIATSLK